MIILFSGTGNTRHCAELLSEHLHDSIVTMDAVILRHPRHISFVEALDTDPHPERVIWMFPIYAWAIPERVADVMLHCPAAGLSRAKHYMVCTCGDDIGMTARQWRRIMDERRFPAQSAFSVQMPNTFVFLPGFNVDTPEVENRKLQDCPGRIALIADRIAASGKSDTTGANGDDVRPGSFPRLKSGLLRRWFNRHCTDPNGFNIDTDKCISCGLCVSACPVFNISLVPEAPDNSCPGPDQTKYPHWGTDCLMCTRCYHICPQHAISYKHTSPDKGQYTHFLRPAR